MTNKKTYRNFAVSTMAATAVVAAVAPAVSAATYPDVPETNDHYEAIMALTEQGVVKGYADGTFGVWDSVTRGQVAVMLTKALELEVPTNVADVLEVYDDVDENTLYASHIAAVTQAGIFSGDAGQFNAGEDITREQMATVLVKGFGLADYDTGVDVDANLENVSPSHDENVQTLLNLEISNQTADFHPAESISRGAFSTMVYLSQNVTEAPATPAVESVSAINLMQVEVVLSGDIDLEEAKDVANYSFEDAEGNAIAVADVQVAESDASVSSVSAVNDETRVIVTLADMVTNQGTATITVDESVTGEEFTQEIEFLDFEIPEVDGAEVVGSKTIKVHFSEPINTDATADLKDAFQLNDGSQFVKSVTFLNNNTEANVEFYTDLEEGTQTISVSNDLEDFAGYSVIAKDVEVEVVVDETAPELVEVKNVTPTKATLVFDEEIVDSTLTLADFYHTNSGETAKTAEVVNGNEIELTFDDTNALPNGTAYIYVAKEAISDLWGNSNEQQLRIAAEVSVDETAPTVEKVEASAQNKLEVTFSEEVDASTGTYTLLDEDGEEVDVVGNVDYKLVDGEVVKDTLVISLDDNIYGTHTLVAEDVEDLVGNALDSSSTDFMVEDETAPSFGDFSSTLYQDDQATEILVVDFGEEMAVSGEYSVLDTENYLINDQSLADADSVKITATDKNSKVRIEVKGLDLGVETGGLEIGRVADAAGNKTDALSGLVDIDGASVVDVYSVQAIDNNKVKVTLEDLVTDFDKDDFVLKLNGTPLTEGEVVGATIDNSGSKSVITFTLSAGYLNDAAQNNGFNVTVETIADIPEGTVDTVNSFGEKVQFTATPAVDKIVGSVADADSTTDGVQADVLVSFTDANSDGNVDKAETATFTVNYTEAIKASTLSSLAYEVDGFTVSSVAIGTDATDVVITATANADNTDYMTEVTQVIDITDANGNVIDEGSSYDVYNGAVTVPNSAPAVVSGSAAQTGSATPASADGTTTPAVSYDADASAWFTDADQDTLTYSVVSAKDQTEASVTGVTLDPATGDLTYTPAATEAGDTVTIEVKANDGSADSGIVTITVTVGAVPA